MSNFDNIPKRQSYAEYKQELAQEQAGLSRADIANPMKQSSEAIFDPETVARPTHNWIDRGVRFSCEGAGHPNHYAYKQGVRTGQRLLHG